MRERKKTAVHGTLGMTYRAVEFNFQQVLLKTLIPTMNTLKDTAVLNIIKTDGKCAPEANREDYIYFWLSKGENESECFLLGGAYIYLQ